MGSTFRDRGEPARKLLRWSAYAILGIAGFALFFRHSVASGLDAIPGNIGDARFVLYVCEHWHKVFAGRVPWLSPPILYPTQGVLGYSEALFAFGGAYSVLRHLGLDPFGAYQTVVMALPLVGYAGAVWLLRRGFGFGSFAAVVGGLLFAYSSPMATSMAHAQLQAVAFVPYLLLFAVHFLSSLGSPGRMGMASGLAFAVGFPLLAYTCFYIAWFVVLFACLAILLVVGARLALLRLDVLAAWGRAAGRGWKRLVVSAFVLVVCTIPFVLTYAPVVRLFERRRFAEEVLPLLPVPIDLLNVGFENAVWGPALRKLAPGLDARPGFWELDKGIPFVLLALFVASCAYVLLRYRQLRTAPAAPAVLPAPLLPAAALLCAATTAIAWLLMVRLGNRTLWSLVYDRFPGGGAVRAAFRSNTVLMLPLVIVVAYGLDLAVRRLRRLRAAPRATGLVALSLLAGFLVVEEHNGHRDVLGKREERALLAGAPAPPAACRTMVVTADKDLYAGWWAPLQLHAMLVSQKYEIPTVNGYSGWTPEPWDLHFPAAQGYRERVRLWASRNGVLDGLCAYHVDTRAWSPFEAGSSAAIPSSRDR